MTSQRTFTCSKSTRETMEVDVVLMSLFFTIAGFKQENVYLDSFFWLWDYIHLHKSFSNNKALLSSTRTSHINVWNNKYWNVSERSNFLLLLGYVYEKQFGLLSGITHSPRCFWYVESLLVSFCVYFNIRITVSPGWQIQFCQPGETVMRMLMYQFKLT